MGNFFVLAVTAAPLKTRKVKVVHTYKARVCHTIFNSNRLFYD